MKTSLAFENAIKKYLDEYASNDSVFAVKYENPKKSISECCSFIASEVRKMGVCGLDDAEVYGLAVHYYDEEDITVDNNIKYQVACNYHVELTEEQKEEAKAEAFKQYQKALYDQMVANNLKSKKSSSAKEASNNEPNRPTLFD